ncbi:uncharacterized protein LOC126589603 [Malus sylvestris]|uniref:uncharacterized protein LOC126589603 n=1 Tax=Malus sylvestris TaxID=3752 RepID=UPI0021ABA864|nr:uncharacterized protein LOC126589603 [Malus sylvestris]
MAPPSAPSSQKSSTTQPFFPFRKLSMSLMFFSLKELKIMSTSMCFDCLHMAHGVITRHAGSLLRCIDCVEKERFEEPHHINSNQTPFLRPCILKMRAAEEL